MKVRKLLALACAAVMVFSLVACSGNNDKPAAGGDTVRVALLLNGTLGDKSFNDSAANGMAMVEEKLEGIETKVIEMTADDTKWEPAVLDAADEGYDIIISGTWQMQDIIAKIAPEYPDIKFILYDAALDNEDGKYDNVYSIEYKQNDGSFLAGVLAASMSETGKIGFVGGMDNTVIYDFLVGYIHGAQTVNPDIKVSSAFVGNFTDSARAKELATNQYNMGCDIIFSCASNAGDGNMQAAKSLGKLVIGVDSDQAMLYKENDEEMANLIPTSVLKCVDMSLYQAIEANQKGELAWGTKVAVGIPEECVGLAENEIYSALVPAETQELVKTYTDKIQAGEIEVKSSFAMENDELLAYVDAAK